MELLLAVISVAVSGGFGSIFVEFIDRKTRKAEIRFLRKT